MISKNESEAMAEVLDIINHSKPEDLGKIPKKFIQYLYQYSSKNYKCNFDYNKNIKDFNLKKETKGYLALICRDYLTTPEEKIEFTKVLDENENIKNNSVQTNNIKFDNNQDFINESNLPVVVSKEKWYKRVWKNILSLFKR